LEYQDIQFGVPSSKPSRICLSVNAWLPTMLISLIFATWPSRISMSMATRLRSSCTTCGITVTLYLPRL